MAEDLVKLGARTPSVPEFADVVRRRRMTRAFDGPTRSRRSCSTSSSTSPRAPSAGKTQGWHLVVLEGAETAPLLGHHAAADASAALPLAAPARRARDRPAARRSAGVPRPLLGGGQGGDRARRRPTRGRRRTGRRRFKEKQNRSSVCERQLRRALGIPAFHAGARAIALGWPADIGPPAGADETGPGGPGRSASQRRRRPDEIIHRGGWRVG